MKKRYTTLITIFSIFLTGCSDSGNGSGQNEPEGINTSAPTETAKLVFIHHSCGSNWLNTYNGNLGNTLGDNNYYVRDISYGWDATENEDIGNHTDTSDWPSWFTDTTLQGNGEAKRDNIMGSVYTTTNKSAVYDPITDPEGENDIIMFKSCYPCSEVGDSIDDEKAIYNDILTYFQTRPDKLFVLITPPGETEVSSHEKTRELCNWLVDEENGWLKDYSLKNVGVFDFYCVLSEENSHHRIKDGAIEHVFASDYDGTSPYHDGDNHPNREGNLKSTEEFVPLLNHYYNRWKSN